MEYKKLLHVGCGPLSIKDLIGFNDDQWKETRLDISPDVSPDIIDNIVKMDSIASGNYDALYSSHNIEHLYAHEVILALKEFRRVLNEDGFAVIRCPDIQSVADEISRGKITSPLYESSAGPISALDILYGHCESLASGKTYMAHKTGFTYDLLHQLLSEAGFKFTCGFRLLAPLYEIWQIAFKGDITPERAMEYAEKFLPELG